MSCIFSQGAAPIMANIQLDLYVANEVVQMLSSTLDEIARFLQPVIDEAERTFPPDAHSFLLSEIKKLVNLIGELDENSDELDEIGEMFDLIGIAQIFDPSDYPDLSDTDQIVVRILEEHGIEVFEQKLIAKFDKTMHKIEQRIEKYIMGMSDSKATRKADFIEWFNDFKNESDIGEKIEMLFSQKYLFA
ncbi:hypothetical protein KR067_009302 [Drosophila pandora]|nr:hypothetical protein KR067_009302 [Drosophila pandora]